MGPSPHWIVMLEGESLDVITDMGAADGARGK